MEIAKEIGKIKFHPRFINGWVVLYTRDGESGLPMRWFGSVVISL